MTLLERQITTLLFDWAFLGAGKQSCSYMEAPEDIRMGKNAEVLTVAVPSSFPGSKDLHEAHPDIHLASIKELLLHS